MTGSVSLARSGEGQRMMRIISLRRAGRSAAQARAPLSMISLENVVSVNSTLTSARISAPLYPWISVPCRWLAAGFRLARITGSLDTWIPGYLDTWIPGYLDTCTDLAGGSVRGSLSETQQLEAVRAESLAACRPRRARSGGQSGGSDRDCVESGDPTEKVLVYPNEEVRRL